MHASTAVYIGSAALITAGLVYHFGIRPRILQTSMSTLSTLPNSHLPQDQKVIELLGYILEIFRQSSLHNNILTQYRNASDFTAAGKLLLATHDLYEIFKKNPMYITKVQELIQENPDDFPKKSSSSAYLPIHTAEHFRRLIENDPQLGVADFSNKLHKKLTSNTR